MRFFLAKVLPISVAAIAVIVFGAYSGYVVSEKLPAFSGASPSADPGDAGTPSTDVRLIRKRPVPNDLPGLVTKGLDYREVDFSLRTKPNPAVRIGLHVPRGWTYRSYTKEPWQVRYIDPTGERALRIESGFDPQRGTYEMMNSHIAELVSSQPPENDLRVISREKTKVVDVNGNSRTVSTLVYTFIPSQTLRYVAVRWVAINGDKAAVEMTVNGLPQDAKALTAILEEATRTVTRSGLPS